jgi:hypothetical protein
MDLFDPLIWDQDGDGIPDWDDLDIDGDGEIDMLTDDDVFGVVDPLLGSLWDEWDAWWRSELERLQREAAEEAARRLQQRLDEISRQLSDDLFGENGEPRPASP